MPSRGQIQLNISIILPKGWELTNFFWKLNKYAYGICESGLIWQLVIEDLLKTQLFDKINGLTKILIRRQNLRIVIALCKTLEEVLVFGSPKRIQEF